jgi:hypothetical protein
MMDVRSSCMSDAWSSRICSGYLFCNIANVLQCRTRQAHDCVLTVCDRTELAGSSGDSMTTGQHTPFIGSFVSVMASRDVSDQRELFVLSTFDYYY